MTKLEELRDAILIHGPEHFNMSFFVAAPNAENRCSTVDARNLASFDINNCGTTGCIAGHGALIMAQEGFDFSDIAVHDEYSNGWTNEVIEAVGNYFEIPDAESLFLYEWRRVPSFNGLDLLQHFEDRVRDPEVNLQYGTINGIVTYGSTLRGIEYDLVLDHLDWLIKNQANKTED